MDIAFKGRHTTVQDRFRQHAIVKLAKLAKLNHKVIRIDVEVSQERNPRQNARRERVELTIQSRGPAIRAEAAADDRYGALDLAIGKLESRLRRARDRRKTRHASHGPAKVPVAADGSVPSRQAAASRPAEEAPRADDQEVPAWPAEEAADGVVPIEMDGDGPLVVRQKFHTASPMTIDQALFEMELVGHDFYLFRDKPTGCPSVVYRRHGYQYGVIRLVEGQIPSQSGQMVAS
ncbi:MAG TPA: ribosome-associated translation inhibitor RaiA [Streptosporangiaceae bacterium]|nr:ribosome-associated translation inhibitor RaiA [Streptosporangiaceae bacterium]